MPKGIPKRIPGLFGSLWVFGYPPASPLQALRTYTLTIYEGLARVFAAQGALADLALLGLYADLALLGFGVIRGYE
jgi:hypothetical protein